MMVGFSMNQGFQRFTALLADGATAGAAELDGTALTGGVLSSRWFASGTVGNARASAFGAEVFNSVASRLTTNGTLKSGDVLQGAQCPPLRRA